MSLTRRKLVLLRALEISELCRHTLYSQNQAVSPSLSLEPNRSLQHGHSAGWASGERLCKLGAKALRAWVTSRTGSGAVGLRGADPCRERFQRRVGNTAKKNPCFCVCRHLVMRATDLHRASHCHGLAVLAHRLTTTPGLAWTVNSLGHQQKQVSGPSVHPFQALRREWRKEGNAPGSGPGQPLGGKASVIGAFRKSHHRSNVGSYLAW